MPKISLVTACHNHKEYIAETIESVLAQNYPNLEYIVIDDGSTDGSWEIIEKYKDRLHFCKRLAGHRDNPTMALNYGFSKTAGEIIGWLNSDDLLLPESLFIIAEVFQQNPKAEWLTGMSSTANYKNQIIASSLNPKTIYDFFSGNWSVIQQESTFWRRELWERAGGKLADTWAFDTELWTRFFRQAEHYHVSAPLGAFRKGKQNASTKNSGKYLKLTQEILKKFFKSANRKEKAAALVYGIGKKITPVLALIPNAVFLKIPGLEKFHYKIISYSPRADKWTVKKISPYKGIRI